MSDEHNDPIDDDEILDLDDFDDDLDADDFDDESWDDLDADNDEQASVDPSVSSRKTFAQKYFNLIVIAVVCYCRRSHRPWADHEIRHSAYQPKRHHASRYCTRHSLARRAICPLSFSAERDERYS